MKILFCGDIIGRNGRNVVAENVARLKREFAIDFVIANCDNASGGFGVNKNAYQELLAAGIDVLTGGDHIWDQREITSFINDSK